LPPPSGGWRQTRDEERRRIISRGYAFDSRRLSIGFRRTVALATVGRGQQDRRMPASRVADILVSLLQTIARMGLSTPARNAAHENCGRVAERRHPPIGRRISMEMHQV